MTRGAAGRKLLEAVEAGGSGTWVQDVARFLIVLVANFPMGVTGFGDAIIMHIALTTCNMGLPGVCNGAISEAVFNLTVGGLAAMGVQACLIHRDTNWQLVGLLLPPILAGTFVGMLLLYHIHSMWLKRVLGLVFLSVACYQIHGEVTRAKGGPAAPPHPQGGRGGPLDVRRSEVRAAGLLAGAVSGLLAGLFGTGGPPLMVFVASFEVDKDEWRASNAIIWFVDDVFRLLYIYFVQHQLSLSSDVGLLLSLFVAGGLGVWLGSVVSPLVDMALFRRLLILLLLLGANVMLLAGVAFGLAMTGVVSILAGVGLYGAALWHQPSPAWAPKDQHQHSQPPVAGSSSSSLPVVLDPLVQWAGQLLASSSWGGLSGGPPSSQQQWWGGAGRGGVVLYSKVSTEDEDEHPPIMTEGRGSSSSSQVGASSYGGGAAAGGPFAGLARQQQQQQQQQPVIDV